MSVSAPCEHALTVVIHFPACPHVSRVKLVLAMHYSASPGGRGLLCAELAVPLPTEQGPVEQLPTDTRDDTAGVTQNKHTTGDDLGDSPAL